MLEYILDPQGYAAREAEAYIAKNQNVILYAFLTISATAAEYKALTGNPHHPAHRVKRIMKAMNDTPAKTVRVTIRKDGVEFTFKTEADELRRDCVSYYGIWRTQASDRREFERLFGRCSHYVPEDILRIEYGRTVLYEAEVAVA